MEIAPSCTLLSLIHYKKRPLIAIPRSSLASTQQCLAIRGWPCPTDPAPAELTRWTSPQTLRQPVCVPRCSSLCAASIKPGQAGYDRRWYSCARCQETHTRQGVPVGLIGGALADSPATTATCEPYCCMAGSVINK